MPMTRKVWEFMEPRISSVREDTSLTEVIRRFADLEKEEPFVSLIAVVDPNGHFRGTIGIKKLLKRVKALFDDACQGEKLRLLDRFLNRCSIEGEKAAKEFMVTDAWVAPSDTILKAFEVIMENDSYALAVVDAQKPIGVLSIHGLFRAMRDVLRKRE